MIYIFTHSYPYARRGEVFLVGEVRAVQAMGLAERICFVPLRKEKGVDKAVTPGTIKAEVCRNDGIGHWVRLVLSMLFQRRFWRMRFDFRNSKLSRFTCWKQGHKYFYAAWIYADWIRRHRHGLHPGDILYSYWAHYNVLGMALAREKGWLPAGVRCVSRGHRYDIYEEQGGCYFPYRKFALAVLDGLYPCSQYGVEFLRKRYPEIGNRIRPAYLGVWPVGRDDVSRINALSPSREVCRVVSCSFVSKVKRLDLLLRSLAAFSEQMPGGKAVEWHHFGGGAGLSALRKDAAVVNQKYPRFKIVFHGDVDNKVVREAYLNTYFDAFVNVSESEGLPVTLMEAFAAGIPVVATDVGGSREIVRFSYCFLDKDFTQTDFNQALFMVLQGGEALRKEAYDRYLNTFSAEKNYTEFYRRIDALA